MANYIDTWKNVIMHPTLFFENMPVSGGYGEPIRFALINCMLGIGLIIFLFLIQPPTYYRSVIDLIIFLCISFLITGVAGLFIYFIVFKIMGGKGSIEGTFRQLAYSSAPVALPIIPILPLYSLYLIIVGGKYVHNMGKLRSAVAVFLPIVIGLYVIVDISDNESPPALVAPTLSIWLKSANTSSIELWHGGGDSVKISRMQFVIKKANGAMLRPSISNMNSTDDFAAGDTIRLESISFGNKGDEITITVIHTNSYGQQVLFDTNTKIN